jgi:hypothetical protein
MCAKCIRLVHTVRLREPAQFFDLAERLRRYVSGGTPQIVQASSPIDELRREMPVQDTYFFALRCTTCG